MFARPVSVRDQSPLSVSGHAGREMPEEDSGEKTRGAIPDETRQDRIQDECRRAGTGHYHIDKHGHPGTGHVHVDNPVPLTLFVMSRGEYQAAIQTSQQKQQREHRQPRPRRHVGALQRRCDESRRPPRASP